MRKLLSSYSQPPNWAKSMLRRQSIKRASEDKENLGSTTNLLLSSGGLDCFEDEEK
jgi:hypothetical protein